MQVARNQAGDWIYAYQVSEDQDLKVYCPTCQQALVVKRSKLGKVFFAHRTACLGLGNPWDQEANRQESANHKAFKRRMLDYFQFSSIKIEAEKYLPRPNLFADIWISYQDRTWVLEFQQSPIPASLLSRRHQAYQDQSLTTYWLVSAKVLGVRRLGQFYQAMTLYHESFGYYWLVWEAKDNHLQLILLETSFYHHWDQESQHLSCPYIYLLNLDFFFEQELGRGPVRKQNHYVRRTSMSPNQIKSILMNPSYRRLLKDLYLQKISLWTLPNWVFASYKHCLLLACPAWVYWAYLLDYLKRQTGPVPIQAIYQTVEDLSKRGLLVLADLPLINQDPLLLLIKDSLAILQGEGLIHFVNQDHISLCMAFQEACPDGPA